LARVLLAGERHGVIGDLKVMQDGGVPASWYVDPVRLGLTVIEPDFIDSMRLAWRVCQAVERVAPALRLSPAIVDVPRIDGSSAGAMFACAMVAAVQGEQLNEDATVSVAMKLKGNRSLDDGLPIHLADIELINVGSLELKFDAAHRGRPASPRLPAVTSLKRVVLTAPQSQMVIDAGWHQSLKSTIEVVPANTLDDVFHALTGNARIERVMRSYAVDVLAEWNSRWTDPDSERGSLLYYVPPAYRLFDREMGTRDVDIYVSLPESETGADSGRRLKHVDIDVRHEEEALLSLLNQAGDRLCLSEGPGAGKTTFTHRLRAFLSSARAWAELNQGKPLLALRWEEAADSYDYLWPTDFPAAIAQKVATACDATRNGASAVEVAQYALRQGSVVLILDALDQVSNPTRVTAFHEFLKQVHRQKWRVRVVLTGRTYAVDAIKQQLAYVGDWRFGAILPFDTRRQHAYLHGPVNVPDSTDPWANRSLDETKVRRLVAAVASNPDDDQRQANQRYEKALTDLLEFYTEVKELLGNPNTLFMVRRLAEQGKLVKFRNRSELYCQTSSFMLQRAARKLRKWPTEEGPTEAAEHPVVLEDIRRWEAVLAATAFAMMAINPGHFRVLTPVNIETLRKAVERRLANPPTRDEWQLIEQVAQYTNRSILYASDDQLLAWPDPRMMEFYCGLHLAKNSQSGWVTDTGNPHSSPRCGESVVRENAANAEWFEAFRFAIEMPASHRMDPVLLASLAELFEPVTQPVALRAATPATSDASGSNEPWLRPTELMYRAWCLLEELPPHERAQPSPQRLAGGERVLAAFRRQFQRQLEIPGDIGRVASEIRDGFVIVPALEQTALALTKGQAISIDAFKLGRTAITRAQYLLFDPSWKEVNAKGLRGYKDQSPRCPAQFIDWYDAWCAARYFGARLPTEAEWEYACAAGSRKRYCRVAHGEDLDTEAGLERVADFGRDWDEGPREVDVGRDLPGGGRRRLEPNAFGLIGMLGGVWEWCVSWDGDSVDEILSGADRNPVGPDRGSARVIRGGSFAGPAGGCRPAGRLRNAPSYRDSALGFRLALSFVGVPADSRQDKNG
jgi:hypothetical protein